MGVDNPYMNPFFNIGSVTWDPSQTIWSSDQYQTTTATVTNIGDANVLRGYVQPVVQNQADLDEMVAKSFVKALDRRRESRLRRVEVESLARRERVARWYRLEVWRRAAVVGPLFLAWCAAVWLLARAV